MICLRKSDIICHSLDKHIAESLASSDKQQNPAQQPSLPIKKSNTHEEEKRDLETEFVFNAPDDCGEPLANFQHQQNELMDRIVEKEEQISCMKSRLSGPVTNNLDAVLCQHKL